MAGGFDGFAFVLGPKSASGGADSVLTVLTAQLSRPGGSEETIRLRLFRHSLPLTYPVRFPRLPTIFGKSLFQPRPVCICALPNESHVNCTALKRIL